MKTKLPILLLICIYTNGCASAGIVTNQTQVLFPISQMFGGDAYSKPFRVDAVKPLITDGTNIYIGSYQTVSPTGGTNPIVSLTPNDYLVTFQDARTPWRISVPATNVLLNALELTSGSLPTFNYVPSYATISGFSGIVTNLSSYQPNVVTTNFSYSTNRYYNAVGAGNANVNGYYYPTGTGTFTNSLANILAWNAPNWQLTPNGYYVATGGTSNSADGLTWQAIGGYPPPPTVSLVQTIITNPVVSTNIVQHFNLTTFSNGIVTTNVYQ